MDLEEAMAYYHYFIKPEEDRIKKIIDKHKEQTILEKYKPKSFKYLKEYNGKSQYLENIKKFILKIINLFK